MSSKKLLVATNNAGKVTELAAMLDGRGFDLVSLSAFPQIAEVEETGQTFEENARLKASGYARAAGLPALADDSGLEVDALGKRPGVLSARYGGDALDFAGKMDKLLGELSETADQERRARFVCSMAVADSNGNILFTSQGVCEGKIADGPRGKGGFGYDPIFIPDGFDGTFGELSHAIKANISHRALAFCEIMPFLRDFMKT